MTLNHRRLMAFAPLRLWIHSSFGFREDTVGRYASNTFWLSRLDGPRLVLKGLRRVIR
jgi:hypothetical protein